MVYKAKKSPTSSSSADIVKEIYALRREFKNNNDQSTIELAMQKASDLVDQEGVGAFEWNAYGYCLVSLYFSPHRKRNDQQYNQYLYHCAQKLINNMQTILGTDPFSFWENSDDIYAKKQSSYLKRILNECAGAKNIDENSSLIDMANFNVHNKNYAQAIKQFKQACTQQDTLTQSDKINYAWSLYYHGREIIKQQDPTSYNEVKDYIQQYLELFNEQSINHSLNRSFFRLNYDLYSQDKKLYQDDFINFCFKLNLNTLAQEDFQDHEWNAHLIEGIGTKILRTLGKYICNPQNHQHPNFSHILYTLEPIFTLNEQYPSSKQAWLYYYHGRILLLLGKNNDGLAKIQYALKLLPTSFTIWEFLGDYFQQHNQHTSNLTLSAGMYVLALFYADNIKWRAPLHLKLGLALHNINEDHIAFHEICCALKDNIQFNKELQDKLNQSLNAPWFNLNQQPYHEYIKGINTNTKGINHARNYADFYYQLMHNSASYLGITPSFTNDNDDFPF